MGGVVVVVVCGGDGTAGTLVLADGPVLEVVVATVDEADLVLAAVAGEGTNGGSLGARVVVTVVLEDLSRNQF